MQNIINWFKKNKAVFSKILKVGFNIFAVIGLVSFILWIIGYRQFLKEDAIVDRVAVSAIGYIGAILIVWITTKKQIKNQNVKITEQIDAQIIIQEENKKIKLFDKYSDFFYDLKEYIMLSRSTEKCTMTNVLYSNRPMNNYIYLFDGDMKKIVDEIKRNMVELALLKSKIKVNTDMLEVPKIKMDIDAVSRLKDEIPKLYDKEAELVIWFLNKSSDINDEFYKYLDIS